MVRARAARGDTPAAAVSVRFPGDHDARARRHPESCPCGGSGPSVPVSTGPAPDGVPPATLDAAALARLRELDPDGRHGVVVRVLESFEASLGRLLGQLRAERDAGEPTVVAGIAHTLKSSSASVGALALSASCSEIERRLREGAEGDLHADVQRLLAEGEAALRAVGSMLRP
jgi:histidine phosphotransfer protein HptB